MGRRLAHRRAPVALAALALAAAALLAPTVAAWLWGRQAAEVSARAHAAGDAGGGDGGTAGGIDWDWLREQNADVVAWLTVEGTSIDMPVMAPSEEHPGDWYLSHDLEGGWSYVGCAYVDDRTTADSAHALVYGHHITGSHLAFTEIYDAHEQEAFDGIGAMRWHTPARGETVLAPCMAMVVDQDDAGIQRFAFHGDAGLRSWLATLSDRASARAPDCAARCAMATRVVTLVTCANDEGGQRERTLVIFVA